MCVTSFRSHHSDDATSLAPVHIIWIRTTSLRGLSVCSYSPTLASLGRGDAPDISRPLWQAYCDTKECSLVLPCSKDRPSGPSSRRFRTFRPCGRKPLASLEHNQGVGTRGPLALGGTRLPPLHLTLDAGAVERTNMMAGDPCWPMRSRLYFPVRVWPCCQNPDILLRDVATPPNDEVQPSCCDLRSGTALWSQLPAGVCCFT